MKYADDDEYACLIVYYQNIQAYITNSSIFKRCEKD